MLEHPMVFWSRTGGKAIQAVNFDVLMLSGYGPRVMIYEEVEEVK